MAPTVAAKREAQAADRERLDREAASTKPLAEPGAARAPPIRPAIPFADRMVRPTRAAQMFDISVPGLYDWIAAGTFPAPRVFGAGQGCVGWLESELVGLMRSLPHATGKVGKRSKVPHEA